MKLREFLIGTRRAAAVGNVQAGQRPEAVDAVGESLGLVVRGLQVAPGLGLFADVVVVLVGVEIVGHYMARGIDDAELAAIEGEAVVLFRSEEHTSELQS